MRMVENYKVERAKDQPERTERESNVLEHRIDSHSNHVIFKVATKKDNKRTHI